MTEKKRFIYCEEENGEFPFPYIKYDGKKVISLYECVDLLNKLAEENQHLEYDNKRMVKFIMSKGYGFKDYLDFCKEYEE